MINNYFLHFRYKWQEVYPKKCTKINKGSIEEKILSIVTSYATPEGGGGGVRGYSKNFGWACAAWDYETLNRLSDQVQLHFATLY